MLKDYILEAILSAFRAGDDEALADWCSAYDEFFDEPV